MCKIYACTRYVCTCAICIPDNPATHLTPQFLPCTAWCSRHHFGCRAAWAAPAWQQQSPRPIVKPAIATAISKHESLLADARGSYSPNRLICHRNVLRMRRWSVRGAQHVRPAARQRHVRPGACARLATAASNPKLCRRSKRRPADLSAEGGANRVPRTHGAWVRGSLPLSRCSHEWKCGRDCEGCGRAEYQHVNRAGALAAINNQKLGLFSGVSAVVLAAP
eukprot:362200-Chlamydomonas_euryale.AAC.18